MQPRFDQLAFLLVCLLLRSAPIFAAKECILRNAARISLRLASSEKYGARRHKKTAQRALFELQISCSTSSATGAERAKTYNEFPAKKRLLSCAKRRVTAQQPFSSIRHVWQPSHRGALVVRREMRVLTRHGGAVVTNDFPRDKIRDARCFQHCDRSVAQTVEGNLACFTRLVAAFARALVAARQRLNQSGFDENFPELIRQRRRALRARCAGEMKAFGLSPAGSDAN